MTARKIDPERLRDLALAGRPLREMAETFHVKRTDTVRLWLQRDGIYHKWRERRRKEHWCEHCGQPAAERFCSSRCWGLSQRRVVDASLLAPYIERGTPLLRMAGELKLDRGFLRAVMVRQGLYRAWAQHRYKKCASPTVGSSSVNTASAATVGNGPSAKLEVQMGGGTSYGA